MTIVNWDKRFLDLALEVSNWSKDPSTKCGAVIIGAAGQVLSQGFNGFPRGIRENEARYNHKPTKYLLVVHAEMNAIYNASRIGTSLEGSTMYVSGLPICSECAKGIVQVGISKVVMPVYDSTVPEKWAESGAISKQILEEGGVSIEYINVYIQAVSL